MLRAYGHTVWQSEQDAASERGLHAVPVPAERFKSRGLTVGRRRHYTSSIRIPVQLCMCTCEHTAMSGIWLRLLVVRGRP